MASLKRHEGYLQIDHRHSPGLSAAFARQCGLPITAAGSANFESAVVTCAHCSTQVVLNPDRSRPRGYCGKCDHYICDNPVCSKTCRPFKQVLDQVEHLAHRFLGREDDPASRIVLTDAA